MKKHEGTARQLCDEDNVILASELPCTSLDIWVESLQNLSPHKITIYHITVILQYLLCSTPTTHTHPPLWLDEDNNKAK